MMAWVDIHCVRGYVGDGAGMRGQSASVSSCRVELGLSRAEPSAFRGELLADSPHPSRLGFEPQGLEDRL